MMKIADCVSWIDEEDLCVVINTDSKKCVSLDDSGKIIWRLMRECVDIDYVYEKICSEFPTSDAAIIRRDVDEFFDLLLELQIITVVKSDFKESDYN